MNQNKYKDYALAQNLRIQISKAVAPFLSPSHLFTPKELRILLVQVFKFKQYQVSYELLKILFYGKSKYQHVTLVELVNYILQRHLGQNAMNVFSIRQGQTNKTDKLLTKTEFIRTINIGLEFLKGRNVEEDEKVLQTLYSEIDKKSLGIIRQEEYQMFLKEYFGSQSPVNHKTDLVNDKIVESFELISLGKSSQKNDITPLKAGAGQLFQSKYMSQVSKTSPRLSEHLQPLEQLKDFAQNQIKLKCLQFDSDGDEMLTKNETYQFFYHVLELQKTSILYILDNYFDFQENPRVGTAQLIQVISEVHFRQVFSMLLKQELKIEDPSECFMSCEYFVKKIIQNCFFFKKIPDEDLLIAVFKELEGKSQPKKSGFITLQDFRSYVLTALCNNRLIFRKYSKKNTHNALLTIPLSIPEVENSNCEQDSSYGEIKPRQFTSSICEPYNSEKLLKNQKQHIDSNTSNYNREDIRYGSGQQQTSTDNNNKMVQNHLNTIPSQIENTSELTFSTVQRKKGSVLHKSKSNLKEVLWSSLFSILQKYSKSKKNFMKERQVLTLLESQPFFKQLEIKDYLLQYFAKSYEIPHHLLTQYIIHKSGQHSLKTHNKAAIKGKSILDESEVKELLHDAYGGLQGVSKEICRQYSRQLKYSDNGKLSYKDYLVVIARVLSQNAPL